MATTPSGRGRMPRSMPPSATSARKSVRVHAWLKDHPDCPSHFMPAAGTDAVEGLFSKPSRQRLKNAVFNSLDASIAAVEGCIDTTTTTTPGPSAGAGTPTTSSRRGSGATGGCRKNMHLHKMNR